MSDQNAQPDPIDESDLIAGTPLEYEGTRYVVEDVLTSGVGGRYLVLSEEDSPFGAIVPEAEIRDNESGAWSLADDDDDDDANGANDVDPNVQESNPGAPDQTTPGDGPDTSDADRDPGANPDPSTATDAPDATGSGDTSDDPGDTPNTGSAQSSGGF